MSVSAGDPTAPVRDPTAPVSDLTIPVRDLTIPPRDPTVPVRDLTAPVNDLTVPVRDLTVPVRDLTVPVRDLTVPMRDLTVPVRDPTAPVSDLTAPVRDLTAPVRDLTVPAVDPTVSAGDPRLAWTLLKPLQSKSRLDWPNPTATKPNESVRFVIVSDTHGKHDRVNIPGCDVFLHCGDFEGRSRRDLEQFDAYLASVPAAVKILIAGNHDLEMHKHGQKEQYQFRNCRYLQDCSTTAFGYKVYGSPWIPFFRMGAFVLDRDERLADKWRAVPVDTDILMSHGPPVGYGDKTRKNGRQGDVALLQEVQARIRPLLHVFGHIHEDRGCWTDGVTTFVNASTFNVQRRPINAPFVIDLPTRGSARD